MDLKFAPTIRADELHYRFPSFFKLKMTASREKQKTSLGVLTTNKLNLRRTDKILRRTGSVHPISIEFDISHDTRATSYQLRATSRAPSYKLRVKSWVLSAQYGHKNLTGFCGNLILKACNHSSANF